MHGRSLLVLAAISAVLLFAPSAAAGCIARHGVPIASGPSPSGEPWTVEGTIGTNGGCHHGWLLGMSFNLPGVGTWETATGIPTGGHLSRNYRIDAFDAIQEDGAERVFAGVVGGEVATVTATLSNGKRLEIEPRSAPAQLRRHVVWLRNVRYFVQYYLPKGFVTSVSLFSASGLLLYMEGSFF